MIPAYIAHVFGSGGGGAPGYDDGVITGVHAIVFSPQEDKLRAFFGDVLGLPPAELAVHPAGGPARHELFLMCDDIHATLAELRARGAEVAGGVTDQGWGLLASIRLPDGEELGIYEPRHPSPNQPGPPAGGPG